MGLRPRGLEASSLANHCRRVRVDAVGVDLVGRDPGHASASEPGDRLRRRRTSTRSRRSRSDSGSRPASSRCTRSKVSMIGPTSTSRPVSSLISRRDRILQRFAELEQPARQRPLALARLVRALDDQRLAVAHDHRADANHRMRGVFSGHEVPHRIPDLQHPGAHGLREHHAEGRGRGPQERRQGRAVPGQRDAHHRLRVHQRRRARAAPGLREVARAAGAVRRVAASATRTTAPARTTPTPT